LAKCSHHLLLSKYFFSDFLFSSTRFLVLYCSK